MLLLLTVVGCSGGQTDVEVADGPAEGQTPPNVEPQSSANPDTITTHAGVTSSGTAAPSSTAVDASGKFPQGRGPICTQIGCTDQLIINAVSDKQKLGLGAYTVEVDADGKKSTCSLTIDAKGPQTDNCKGDSGALLVLPGAAPIAGAEGGFSLAFKSAPTAVKVVVTKGKTKIAEQSFTPAYKTRQPNGPDCQPTCRQGQESLTLK